MEVEELSSLHREGFDFVIGLCLSSVVTSTLI